MPFTFSHRGSVALIHWGTPLESDIEPVLEHVRRVSREGGRPFLVTYVPADAAAPAPEVARLMVARFRELCDLSASVHQVFGGGGFFVGFKRSVLTG